MQATTSAATRLTSVRVAGATGSGGIVIGASGTGVNTNSTFGANTILTIYWHDSGVLHKATGCRGTFTVDMSVGKRPVMSFKFTGIYSTPTATANATPTLTAFKTPMVVTDTNTADTMFGGTHTTTVAPAITGGTSYPSQGLTLDMGNQVNFTALLGGETVDLTQRAVKGKVVLDLTAANEVTFMSYVENATLQTLGLIHGTIANQKMMIWLPAVQLYNLRTDTAETTNLATQHPDKVKELLSAMQASVERGRSR